MCELAEELEVVHDRGLASRLTGPLVLDRDRDPRRRLASEVAGARIEERADSPARAQELDPPEEAQLGDVPTLGVDERRIERARDVQCGPVLQVDELEVEDAVLED